MESHLLTTRLLDGRPAEVHTGWDAVAGTFYLTVFARPSCSQVDDQVKIYDSRSGRGCSQHPTRDFSGYLEVLDGLGIRMPRSMRAAVILDKYGGSAGDTITRWECDRLKEELPVTELVSEVRSGAARVRQPQR